MAPRNRYIFGNIIFRSGIQARRALGPSAGSCLGRRERAKKLQAGLSPPPTGEYLRTGRPRFLNGGLYLDSEAIVSGRKKGQDFGPCAQNDQQKKKQAAPERLQPTYRKPQLLPHTKPQPVQIEARS